MSKQYNVHAAKSNLSHILNQVEQGEDVIIARDGVPVARLIPIEKRTKIQFGFLKTSSPAMTRAQWDEAHQEWLSTFKADKWD